MNPPDTLAAVTAAARANPVQARVPVQIVSVEKRPTKDGKSFLLLTLADPTAQAPLRVWSDHPQASDAAQLTPGALLAIEGEFSSHPQFGLDARRLAFSPLSPDERAALLDGPPQLRAKQEADYHTITSLLASLSDPRLAALCNAFLAEHGPRFRRAAAARHYHHSRRGGLVEHTAQIMRAADALCAVYPALNRDLLLAAALLHDCGKLWETCPPENSLAIPPDPRGELLGHIVIGIELVNTLWRKITADPSAASWKTLSPPSEDVRLHLLHLIASHHGELQFGAPVVPKTPEAFALHALDKLDATLESVSQALTASPPSPEGIIERVRPLPGPLVTPLPAFTPPAQT